MCCCVSGLCLFGFFFKRSLICLVWLTLFHTSTQLSDRPCALHTPRYSLVYFGTTNPHPSQARWCLFDVYKGDKVKLNYCWLRARLGNICTPTCKGNVLFSQDLKSILNGICGLNGIKMHMFLMFVRTPLQHIYSLFCPDVCAYFDTKAEGKHLFPSRISHCLTVFSATIQLFCSLARLF